MDPNLQNTPQSDNQAPQEISSPTQQPIDNSIYGQSYDSSDNKRSSSKKLIIIALISVPLILIVLGVTAALVVTTYSGIKERAEKATKNNSSMVTQNDLVERTVTNKEKSVTVLVPKSWKDSLEEDGTGDLGFRTSRSYSPNGLEDVVNGIYSKVNIYVSDVTSSTGSKKPSATDNFKQKQLDIEKTDLENSLGRIGYQDCVVYGSMNTKLSGNNFGFTFTYTCKVEGTESGKSVQLEGTKVVTYALEDNKEVVLVVENAEPKKLDQSIYDKIVGSLKI